MNERVWNSLVAAARVHNAVLPPYQDAAKRVPAIPGMLDDIREFVGYCAPGLDSRAVEGVTTRVLLTTIQHETGRGVRLSLAQIKGILERVPDVVDSCYPGYAEGRLLGWLNCSHAGLLGM